MVRQLLAQGLLRVQGEYGVLARTGAAGAVLRGQQEVRLRRQLERATAARRPRTGAAPPVLDEPEQELFQQLDQPVVNDRGVITSRGPEDLPAFCHAVIAALRQVTPYASR